MAGLVIDASVALAVMLPDEADSRAEKAMKAAAREHALVPSHWLLEVVNGLLMAERRRRIPDRTRHALLESLTGFPTEFDRETNNRARRESAGIAVAHKLTIYDAAYLELAMRTRLPLATLDEGLRKAALREKVRLFV